MSQLFQDFKLIAAIAITPTGAKKLQPLCQTTDAILWVPESLQTLEGVQVYTDSLKSHIASLWQNHRAFVFCLATGAVVRIIAPLLENKSFDPAVIVIDEQGKFVISLCSGHQGKADQLTRMIAHQLGATPVLTGASTALNLPGIDILGVPFGWQRGEGDWLGVSAAVAKSEAIQVIQEAGTLLWQNHLPQGHPFQFDSSESNTNPLAQVGITPPNPPLEREGREETNFLPLVKDETEETNSLSLLREGLGRGLKEEDKNLNFTPKARIWISAKQHQFPDYYEIPTVQWHPRVLWVGIGCERGTSKQLIQTAIEQVFAKNQLAQKAIAGIATIDIKADEIGLLELCKEWNLPLKTFPVDILRSVTVPNPSKVVESEVGTPSVAEAAAIVASGRQELTSLIVSKQIVRLENQAGAVTVAIAQSEIEYTGRTGKLLLVGTGPGQLSQMTPAAQTAVAEADAIIGYSLYIDLISPLLRPGQIIEALPITQELQRAQRAIELAKWGLSVAVVSSGDCGIYGMAGLVLEELRSQNWDGKTPSVEVFPGITALQSAASRVGAPLMHDFCAISLSDLLTPWEVIEKRLIAAAQGDFVTALYNPRSQSRTQQLATATAIFLQYRNPNTPVAIVHSAYRSDEQITITNLSQLLDNSVDMLTTVLIGNQSTRTLGDWMITPRGYLGFGEKI